MVKFSVKKPMTVFVAVIAIIVLGIVAFTGMTPDLLPNIDMPYIVVATAWPGANPEKVEAQVTRPMEQAMATLENIENITSTSSSNVSTLVLEFNASVNMDTITVDILQRISQLQPYWEEAVGTPYILKLNPSMIPVSIAAVRMEGMDVIQLSSFLDDTLMNKLEGISGVASISTGGTITETLNVTLNEEKLAVTNARIAGMLEEKFDEALEELEKAQQELDKGKANLESQKSQLEKTMKDLERSGNTGDAAQMEKQVTALKLEIIAQIENANRQLEAARQLEQIVLMALQGGEAAIAADKLTLQTLRVTYEALAARYIPFATWGTSQNPGWDTMTEADRRTFLNTTPDPGDPAFATTLAAFYTDKDTADATLNGHRAGLGDYSGKMEDAVPAVDETIAALEAGMRAGVGAQLEALLNQPGQPEVYPPGTDPADFLAQLQAGIASLQQTKTALQQVLDGLGTGQVALEEGTQQLGKLVESMATIQATSLGLSFASVTAQLEAAQAELDKALKQIEETREETLDKADLHSIITMDLLAQILTAQNFSMPVGYVKEDGQQYLVSVGEEFTSLEQVQGLLLLDLQMEGVDPVYLSEVADVSITNNADEVYARLDGSDGVLLTFSKQSAWATASVSDNITAEFEQLAKDYPGLEFVPLFDQGDYIYLVVQNILENLALGAVFAILILLLFLKDIRPTFVTLCSIPISVVFAIVLMYFSGVTLNIISLSGLAVGVGMLVDNSVVVIENIYRLRHKGVPPLQAAVSGASQVAGAIAASTLTTICVFLPIVFVEGLTRQLFTDLALTLGYSLMASLVVALTLVPAMSSGLLRNVQKRPSPWFDKAMGLYSRSLKWAMGHRAVVLAACVLLLVASMGLVLMRGFSFMPQMDMPQITVEVEMEKDTPLSETRLVADEVARRIGEIEGVETVGAITAGSANMMSLMGGGSGNTQGDRVQMYVMLAESGVSGNEVANEIVRRCADIDATITASGSSMMDMSALGGSGVQVKLYGETSESMLAAARQVAQALAQVEGIASVDDGIGETSPEIRFVVDKDKAMREGLTTAQVYMELAKALATEKNGPNLLFDEKSLTVRIVGGDEAKLTPTYIKYYRFPVTTQTGEEKMISVRDITTLVETETPASIERDNQRRLVTVTGQLADGYNVTLVTQAAQQAMAGQQLPAGVSYEFGGENETIMASMWDLLKMLALGVLLVYLIMVAQFQSLLSPFIVMFTIPLAFTGGFLGLLVTGLELSIVALIGMVMLVGIIVNNGIVLVDYINQLRAEGTEKRQALLEAGVTRMRPILMTSLTTVLGLSVMAVGRGTGSEMMQPVAIVCIGGLLYATLLTLYVVPIMYDLLNRKELRVTRDSDLELVEE